MQMAIVKCNKTFNCVRCIYIYIYIYIYIKSNYAEHYNSLIPSIWCIVDCSVSPRMELNVGGGNPGGILNVACNNSAGIHTNMAAYNFENFDDDVSKESGDLTVDAA